MANTTGADALAFPEHKQPIHWLYYYLKCLIVYTNCIYQRNSTQNVLPIHWKMCLLRSEKLRPLRFTSSHAFLKRPPGHAIHYKDVIMSSMASQITSLTIVYSAVYNKHRKHQSSASLAFVMGIPRWPVNSPHKWPVARKMFPFDDVIMMLDNTYECNIGWCPHSVTKLVDMMFNDVLFSSTV